MSDSSRPHGLQPTRLLPPWDFPGKSTAAGCHSLLQCMKVKSESEVAQSCLTLHDPMDCSLPGSSIHGIFQARVLEWVAIAFSNHINIQVGGRSMITENEERFLTLSQLFQILNNKVAIFPISQHELGSSRHKMGRHGYAKTPLFSIHISISSRQRKKRKP